MPPKKAATSTVVGEYDVELMNEQELRMYIEALKEEHQRMRKFCSLYQKDKNELLGFLKSIQDNIIDRKGVNLQKNWEIQELLSQPEEKSKSQDLLNKITELEDNTKDETNLLESFINLKMTEIRNKEEEDLLLKAICDRNRQIEHMEYLYNLMAIQLKENDFVKRNELSTNCKNNFEEFVNQYNENSLKTLEVFSENKIEELHALWGDVLDPENNLSADMIQKMTLYFKDIYFKNIKTIEKLYSDLMNLKKELNTITLNIRDVIKENERLQKTRREPYSPRLSVVGRPIFSEEKSRNLEELVYENYLLSVKLQMLSKEYASLKTKFLSAMRTIYQKADLKALLLEKHLLSLQNREDNALK